MAGIFAADIYCDSCIDAIKKRLYLAGCVPEHPEDERTYDCNEYPKACGDDETADVPEHCAGGCDCLEPLVYKNENYGHFFGNALTEAGVKYVADTVREDRACGHNDSIACKVWLPHYIADYPELQELLYED